jgi:hypothetical protein
MRFSTPALPRTKLWIVGLFPRTSLNELGHRVKSTSIFRRTFPHLPDAFPDVQTQHRRNALHYQLVRWSRSLPSRAKWTTDLPVEHVVSVSSGAHAKFHSATIAEDKVSFESTCQGILTPSVRLYPCAGVPRVGLLIRW